MLDLLRRQSVLIYGIFGAIVLIFAINFGPGAGGCTAQVRPKQWVARVDGVTVGPELFSLMLSQQYEDMRQRAEASGIKFDRALAERIGIRRRVVDALVDRRLIVAEAEARGLHASDDRLLQSLRDDYGAHDLSYAAYEERVARTANMTVEQFEAYVRDSLTSAYLMHALHSAADVPDDEIALHFVREHERLQLRLAKLPIDVAAVPAPGQAAIDALLTHEPGALQDQYDRDIEDFATPAMARAAQVVRTLPPDAPAEAVAKATAELAEVRAQLESGADFAALVAAFSQDERSKAQGGDMGWLAQSDLDPSLGAALFALPVDGVTSTPVRTKQGLHLVKKLEERGAGRKQLDELRPELAARVLRSRVATAKAEQAAERLLAQLQAGKQSFAQLTRSAGQEPLQLGSRSKAAPDKPMGYETNWLLRTDTAVGALGEAPAIVAAAFGHGNAGLNQPGELLPKPMRTADAVVVVQLKVREHADLGKLAAEHDELYDALVARKRQHIVSAWLRRLRSQAKVDLNPAYLAPAVLPAATDGEQQPDAEEALAG